MSAANQPQRKRFSFRKEDAEFLVYTKQHLDAVYSATISKLAHDRFGVAITEHTQFLIKSDFSGVEIWEQQPTEDVQPNDSRSPIVTG